MRGTCGGSDEPARIHRDGAKPRACQAGNRVLPPLQRGLLFCAGSGVGSVRAISNHISDIDPDARTCSGCRRIGSSPSPEALWPAAIFIMSKPTPSAVGALYAPALMPIHALRCSLLDLPLHGLAGFLRRAGCDHEVAALFLRVCCNDLPDRADAIGDRAA